MSLPSAILSRTKNEDVAKQRRYRMTKGGLAIFCVIVLLSAGYRGRHQARLQAQLDDIKLVCNRLQQKLDEAESSPELLFAGTQGTNTNLRWPSSSDPEVAGLVGILKMRLEPFDFDRGLGKLGEAENLEVRVSKATLAIAERRFADALTMVTDKDATHRNTSASSNRGGFARVLRVRGDAFYGLRQWQNGLDQYLQVLALQTNSLGALARVADCRYALGKRAEALSTYSDLATNCRIRGDDSLIQANTNAALAHYARAVELQTRLVEQEGQNELANQLAIGLNNRGNCFLMQKKYDEAARDFTKAVGIQTRLVEGAGQAALADELAVSHANRGNAFLVRGKPDAAIGDFAKAIEIQTTLIEKRGQTELAAELAMSHNHQGSAFLAQGKFDAAIEHYDNAITILTRLVEKEGRSEWTGELSRSHNNRGVVHRAQGKPDAALGDFEKAIEMATQVNEKQGGGERRLIHEDGRVGRRAQVRLDVAMACAEKSIDALMRTRIVEQGRQRELPVVLALSLKNRGHARLVKGDPRAALRDFTKAVEIYAKLVRQEGQSDLALEFARSLTPIAWISATSPDNSLRDGNKAMQCALTACGLSEWKNSPAIESLAAACAETQNFTEAVKWQENAIELAPNLSKAELRSRLEVYKAGKPFREPAPN